MSKLLVASTIATIAAPSLGVIVKFRPVQAIRIPDSDGLYWAESWVWARGGHTCRWNGTSPLTPTEIRRPTPTWRIIATTTAITPSDDRPRPQRIGQNRTHDCRVPFQAQDAVTRPPRVRILQRRVGRFFGMIPKDRIHRRASPHSQQSLRTCRRQCVQRRRRHEEKNEEVSRWTRFV